MTKIYIEAGTKRTFACAIDWPGWCRSGRDEGQALAALAASAPRYGVVAVDAGFAFTADAATKFEIIERLPGSVTTDFGAPDKAATLDFELLSADEARRLAAILTASWRFFDATVQRALAGLAKGPRGGGRDRDRIVEHVLGAEASYARVIGIRHRQPPPDDPVAVAALREAIAAAVRVGQEVDRAGRKSWPMRYAVRRIAWHMLDHAWEIEDRGGLEPARAW